LPLECSLISRQRAVNDEKSGSISAADHRERYVLIGSERTALNEIQKHRPEASDFIPELTKHYREVWWAEGMDAL